MEIDFKKIESALKTALGAEEFQEQEADFLTRLILKHLRKSKAVKRFGRTATRKRKYQRYLLSSEWQERRSEVIKRCNGVCEYCHNKPVSDVHHLTYRRIFKEELRDLLGVCRECHKELENQKQEIRLQKERR